MAPTDARMGHVACGLADFCSSIDRFARLPHAHAAHSRQWTLHSAELTTRACPEDASPTTRRQQSIGCPA